MGEYIGLDVSLEETQICVVGQDGSVVGRANAIARYVNASVTARWVHGPGMDEPLVEYAGSGTTNRFAGTSIPRIEV